MTKQERKDKSKGWFSIVVGVLLFGAIGLCFFPLLGIKDEEGVVVFVSSIPLLFGGEAPLNGDPYGASLFFEINFGLLISLQILFFGGLLAIIGKNSPRNLLLSILFVLFGEIGIALSPIWVKLCNPALPSSSLSFGNLYYVILGVIGFCAFLLIILRARAKRFWALRKAP